MIQKFEKTVDLGVIRGRGRKGISNKSVEEVTFDVVERESGSRYSASSARWYCMICLSLGLQCERF